MSREWKPGDVAMAMRHDGSECRAILRADYTWRLAEACDNNPPTREFRPLVVIDPERAVPGFSGRLVGSLLAACAEIVEEEAAPRTVKETALLLKLADLFDAATAPPKPDEPLGLGAVVEDADGREWTRALRGSQIAWRESLSDARRSYADVNVVRVLSEGIS